MDHYYENNDNNITFDTNNFDNLNDIYIDSSDDDSPNIHVNSSENINDVLINNYIDNLESSMNNIYLTLNDDLNNNNVDNKVKKDNFFECFNDNISINNTISCAQIQSNDQSLYGKKINDLSTTYIFDKTEFRKQEIDPYDIEEYQIEKIKKKKKFNRNGILSLTMFINDIFTI